MCKILAITHYAGDPLPLITRVWESMSASEKHGYGAAWTDSTGRIHWIRRSHPGIDTLPEFCSGFGAESLGPCDGPIIIHGRTATSPVNLVNTHPFTGTGPDGAEWALVHNGVVSSDTITNESTTCDSELILLTMMRGGVPEIASKISGYYAFFAIESLSGIATLHVVRDSTAKLHVGRLPGGEWVFATTVQLLHVAGSSPAGEFKACSHYEFDKNGVCFSEEFVPQKFKESVFEESANRAFGRSTSRSDSLWEFDSGLESQVETVKRSWGKSKKRSHHHHPSKPEKGKLWQ